ncbi:hypothetical protein RB195_024992 [Necator americanus]|uniref:Uncharacterized protein n=1 Tax=Necator americanus TaxID=51031 RepID=A0ABR1ER10_NECAM
MPREKFAFASAGTKSTHNSVCVARNTEDFNQEEGLRRKLRRQLQPDCDNEWTSRAEKFEKALDDESLKDLAEPAAPPVPKLEQVHRATYAVNEAQPTYPEVLVCIQKTRNGKSGADDGISAEMLQCLTWSGIREMTKIDERIHDS